MSERKLAAFFLAGLLLLALLLGWAIFRDRHRCYGGVCEIQP